MSTMEEQFKCFYLDASKQNASHMLRKCVQDNNSLYDFNCKGAPMQQDTVNSIKRTARFNDKRLERGIVENRLVEGFTGKIFVTDEGPGKTRLPKDRCPDGFGLCPKTGRCIQKCQNCIYRDNMKSQQFNEADPCFPEGTYNGVTNEGFIKCTCGSNNQYCSEDFIKNSYTADGMLMIQQKIMNNIGDSKLIDSLFNIDYL